MSRLIFEYTTGEYPIIAMAIHNGHEVREDVAQLLALDDSCRLREEDPFTGQWTAMVENCVVVQTSRFEMDLNRSREKAVYINPEDAWGLNVWKSRPDQELINQSLSNYDSFYSELHTIFSDLKRRFGKFIVFDLHSYNHRRNGSQDIPANPQENPEVNIGTGTMNDRTQWAPIINRFIQDLSQYNFLDRKLDVRENINFYGRHMAQWTHQNFSESACVLSVEFKKFFMDEWTGQPDHKQIKTIVNALQSTVPGVLKELKKLG